MIPIRTVARLKMRLRNQRMLTRMSEGEGVKVGFTRLCGVATVVPFAALSSCARMRNRKTLDTSLESCLSPLYDSIMNAVTMAEKRPAFERMRPQNPSRNIDTKLTKINRLLTSSFHASHLAL